VVGSVVTEPVPGVDSEWVCVWVVVTTVVGVEIVVGVVGVDELAVVEDEFVVDDELLVGVDVPWHYFTASPRTVAAPWVRFFTSWALVLEGSRDSVVSSIARALRARAQEPSLTASLTALRSPEIVLFALSDSAPLICDVPQPTTKAAANASPPAVIAREPIPMCRVTLEARRVAFMCASAHRLLAVLQAFRE
jgi:hypothetical protein